MVGGTGSQGEVARDEGVRLDGAGDMTRREKRCGWDRERRRMVARSGLAW